MVMGPREEAEGGRPEGTGRAGTAVIGERQTAGGVFVCLKGARLGAAVLCLSGLRSLSNCYIASFFLSHTHTQQEGK